jgi:iron complex transport system permease protein
MTRPHAHAIARACLGVLLFGPILSLALPRITGPSASFVLSELRVPRLLAGILVGGTLGLSGAATQAVFANPLATPSTTGTLAGATLGVLLALVIAPATSVWGFSVALICAFLGALIASVIVAVAAFRAHRRTEDVLLVGIAVTLATTALASGVEDLADSRAVLLASRWSLGNLSQVGYSRLAFMAPILMLVWVALLSQIRALQSLVLGDEAAHAHGVEVGRVRAKTLLLVAVGVALSVAWCGPIAFVGLVVPQLVRLGISGAQRVVMPGSLVAGAGLLVFCDAIARLLIPHRELSVGVITAAVGAPALAWLVLRRQ